MTRSVAVLLTALLLLSALPVLGTSSAAEPAGRGPTPNLLIPRLLNSTYTDRIPIIDGVRSPNEWDVAEMTSALWSERPPAWEETGAHITGPGITSDADCSHVFWSMYDDEFLYFLFDCADDSLWVDSYPSAFWRDDGMEIAIDGALDRDLDQRTDAGYEDGDTFAVPALGQDGITYSSSGGSSYARIWGRNNDWFSAVTNNTTHYMIEVQIRLNAISNPTPGSMIGLNTGQNDDDDGNTTKEGVLRWQGLDGYEVWRNETLWGLLYFKTHVVADAGNSQVVNQGETVQFNGSGSSSNYPDFDIEGTYNWTFTYGGNPVTLTGPQPSYEFDIPGAYEVTLTVDDGANSSATDTLTITVRDTEDPVADAGGDITIDQGTNLTLDASASTDNHPDFPAQGSFEWEIIGVESYTVRLYGIQVHYVFKKPGSFFVRLTVTDPDPAHNTNTTTITVTVKDTEPPVADAGPDITVDDGQYVQFDGSNSTDNDEILKWVWEFYLGTELVNITGKKVQYKFPAPGVYEVRLTVYDYDEQHSSDNITVTVEDINPPVADAGDVREFNEDVEVTLNGELSFDNVGIVSYKWTISSEGTVLADLEGVKPKYNFTEPGLYDITLVVEDAMGLSSEDTVQYNVVDVTKPHADAGQNMDVAEDLPVTFSGAGSTDNVAITTYEWVIESATEPRVRRQGVSFEYVFATPGNYTVTLTATDPSGLWDSDTITVTVRDVTPPVAVAPSSVTIKTGQTVQFDGRASTDNVGIAKYTWEYSLAGAPFTLDGANVTQQFDAKGNYTIKLTVEDAAGNNDTTTFYVLVKRPKTPDDGPGFGLLAVLAAVGVAALTSRRRWR